MLHQLRLFYNLGTAYGLKYIHNPIRSYHCRDLDYDHFLGLTAGEKTHRAFILWKCRKVILTLPEILEAYQAGKDPVIEAIRAARGKSLFFTFVFEYCKHLTASPPNTIQKHVTEQLHSPIDVRSNRPFRFQEKYFSRRRRDGLADPFAPGKIRIALHIRRGDLVHFELEDKILFPFALGKVNSPVYGSFGVQMKEEANRKGVEYIRTRSAAVSRYVLFLERIFALYGEDLFDVLVFSDGFPAKPNWNRMKKLGFPEDLRARYAWRRDHEYDELKKFKNLRMVIGKTKQDTMTTIHGMISADVILHSKSSINRIAEFFKETPSLRVDISDESAAGGVIQSDRFRSLTNGFRSSHPLPG
ncbi:MAG: hypothetical protein ACOY3K_02980 [Candidatus Omnitrophota bacterium]